MTTLVDSPVRVSQFKFYNLTADIRERKDISKHLKMGFKMRMYERVKELAKESVLSWQTNQSLLNSKKHPKGKILRLGWC